MPQFQPALVQLWTEMNRNTMFLRVVIIRLNCYSSPSSPPAEQHRIVAKVDTWLALCDQLEQQLSQDDQQRRRLQLAWPCSNASGSRDSSRFATPR